MAIVILSLPDVMEHIAGTIINKLGYLLPLAVFVVGLIHGLKPSERTWLITISYAMTRSTLIDAVKSTAVSALALTIVWAALSTAFGGLLRSPALSATAATISRGVPTSAGLTSGVTSTLAQLAVVLLACKGYVKSVKQLQLLVNAGKALSPLLLGAFIVVLGFYSYFVLT